MEVRKRAGSPFFMADLVHPGTGERIRVSTRQKTEREAKKAAQVILRRLEDEASAMEGGKSPVTIRQAVDDYVGHLALHEKTSLRSVSSRRDKLLGIGPAFAGRWRIDGERPLHTLEPVDLEQLIRARMKEGNGPATIAHELKLLRAATRYSAGLKRRVPPMMTDGTVRDPWRMPDLPTKTRYLSWDEWQAVFDFMEPARPITMTRDGRDCAPYVSTGTALRQRQDAQDLLVALTLTGGRWSEIARLTWDRVDTDRFEVLRLWGNKDQEERLVPLPEQAVAMFRRRWADEERDRVNPAIFPGRWGGFRSPQACRPIHRAIEACGLNRADIVHAHGRATVHSLRHTFASWLLQHGADLSEVQQALGHATLQMTLRYAHLSQRKTAAKLGRILTGIASSKTGEAAVSAPTAGTSQPAAVG